MAEEKLNSKLYAKYDKQFMVFGSMMNGCQEYIGNMKDSKEVELFTELMWKKSQAFVAEFVDDLYQKNNIAATRTGENNEVPF